MAMTQAERNSKYISSKGIKQVKFNLTPEEYECLVSCAEKFNISRKDVFNAAIKYCIENNIDLTKTN